MRRQSIAIALQAVAAQSYVTTVLAIYIPAYIAAAETAQHPLLLLLHQHSYRPFPTSCCFLYSCRGSMHLLQPARLLFQLPLPLRRFYHLLLLLRSPEDAGGLALLVCQQHRDGSVQPKWRAVLILKHIQIVQAVRLRCDSRTCT
jgi:hypothetical protein